jgi:hypothetical protein
MSRNFVVKVLVVLAAVMFFSAATALADKGKEVAVAYDCVLPNGQTLKAGSYQVHLNEKADEVQFVQKGKVIATVPCHCTMNQGKNQRTEILYNTTKAGKQVMLEMRLRGETKTMHFQTQEGM